MTGELDIVLHGAEDDIVLQIQREILSKPGGDLRDPAWVPFAAALRVHIETQRIIPEWSAKAAAAAAEEALASFHKQIQEQVEPTLRKLANKAARTPHQDYIRQNVQVTMMLGAAFFLVIGFLVYGALTQFSTQPPSIDNYIANGNRVIWLDTCPTAQLAIRDGRTACNVAFWMEPPPRPLENGPFAGAPIVGTIIPRSLQWCCVVGLGIVSAGLTLGSLLPSIKVRGAAYFRAVGVLAGISLGGWLWSVVRLWF